MINEERSLHVWPPHQLGVELKKPRNPLLSKRQGGTNVESREGCGAEPQPIASNTEAVLLECMPSLQVPP